MFYGCVWLCRDTQLRERGLVKQHSGGHGSEVYAKTFSPPEPAADLQWP